MRGVIIRIPVPDAGAELMRKQAICLPLILGAGLSKHEEEVEMESEIEEAEGMAQVIRRKRSQPLTEELRRAYYQHMPPELQKQLGLLAPEEQDKILKIVEEYHQIVEHEFWHLLSGLLQVLIKRN